VTMTQAYGVVRHTTVGPRPSWVAGAFAEMCPLGLTGGGCCVGVGDR
jgi:hypothetical protein